MMKQYNKIAVIGGTGKAGGYVISELVKQGYRVRALTRRSVNPSGALIEFVHGDARSSESVIKLIEGCNAVISTIGPTKEEPDTCSIATGNVIQAMHNLKIERYIELAGLAIETPEDNKGFLTKLLVGIMKLGFPSIIADRQKGYRLLSQSNLEWTLVRVPMIKMSGSAGTVKTSLLDRPGNKISATDLARFLVDQLTNDQFVRKSPFVSN